MKFNRSHGPDRAMMEIELRRAAGNRAAVVLVVLGLFTMMGISSLPDGHRSGAMGLHTESYDFAAPAGDDVAYAREALAVAPPTGLYEEPELVVQHELHG